MSTLLTAAGTAVMVVLGTYLIAALVLSRVRLRAPQTTVDIDGLWWVFLVPALNEERVIRNTVDSLLAIDNEKIRVIVIDDDSDDATAEVLATYDDSRLQVLSRRRPGARLGKGRALNDAARTINDDIASFGGDPDRIIVAIVDADGRLCPDALDAVAPMFADPLVGGVQLQVRIYNRGDGWLPRCQDYEFLTFSTIIQSAREHVGSVGLGGNGQFTRLSALRAVGEAPWSDCLTEDLDLGLRLAMLGWRNRFTSTTMVSQQGLDNVRGITRQRTRWMHGHFQCWRHIPALFRSDLPNRTVFDLAWYLIAPVMTLVVSVLFGIPALMFIGAVALAAWRQQLRLDVRWWMPLYALSFGPPLLLCGVYWRQARDISWWRAVLLAHVLAIYNYVWYVATWRAVARIIRKRTDWAKTARLDETVVAA